MDATKGNIYAILNGNKQFLIPVYQRYYSWETEQCSRLWNDIVDMQKKNKVGHFVGSIMKGWMERENEMIACCSDGTRPVIFKIERIDYE